MSLNHDKVKFRFVWFEVQYKSPSWAKAANQLKYLPQARSVAQEADVVAEGRFGWCGKMKIILTYSTHVVAKIWRG